MENIFKWKKEIQQLIDDKGFTEYNPIQKKAIPLILKGEDVIGISPTGTGKSLAFILPVLQKIDTSRNAIQAIITAPTRELARQLYETAVEINRYDSSYRIKLISSGIDKQRMMESLSVQPHLVVGTVGRLKDLFVDEAVLRLDRASMIVIDEADMTLEMGFITEVDQLCGRLASNLQMMVFSATIPAQLQPFLRKYMDKPKMLEITEQHSSQPHIEHVLINCRHLSYQDKLLRVLPGIQPYVCMIFAKTKQEVHDTCELLRENGYSVVEIHGDLTPRQRKQALRTISNDEATFIVCSDIMARGLDIPSVSHVISLGLPSSLDYYTHRSGRTGRAGRSGISYIFYNEKDIQGLKTLKNKGFEFVNRDFRRNQWVDAKPFDFKPKKTSEETSETIARIVNRPVKKVKPGYKKKIQKEIDDVRRRERRLMIRQSIKAQQKERAKQAQIAKRSREK